MKYALALLILALIGSCSASSDSLDIELKQISNNVQQTKRPQLTQKEFFSYIDSIHYGKTPTELVLTLGAPYNVKRKNDSTVVLIYKFHNKQLMTIKELKSYGGRVRHITDIMFYFTGKEMLLNKTRFNSPGIVTRP